jgi:hypothetical protein
MPENKIETTITTPARMMIQIKALQLGITAEDVVRDAVHSYLLQCLEVDPNCFGTLNEYRNEIESWEFRENS